MHIPHISSCPIFYIRINLSRYSYNYVPHHKRNRTYCLSERLISHSSKGKHAQIVVCWQREAAYAVFMSPTNHKQCIEKLAGSSAVSHPPFPLLYSSSPFFFLQYYTSVVAILVSCQLCHFGYLPQRYKLSGIRQIGHLWMLPKNLPLYVPYRAYFSLPICLNAFKLLCMAEKYPSDKPKGSEKREI